MDNQSTIYQVTQETRKTGIASIKATLEFAGITSRTTLIAWERTGTFPKRVKLSGQRVGYRWSDLYKWADSLQVVEGEEAA
ncbi:transcriptional regulator, AlpA family [Thiothrix eikelboomii]|uniref:Transcriptional regulator, AlpA family n=1 Tax=Thiothrix eikelboomii TaxID=92487 RepID=A0A1T4XEG3_9GAMM|nr:AlpA family phage regulatory protein [Thiothrix eikelboomii]SKA87930.1 transcriptional regulator, AlpA family [Thiothrix eikelboomii]